MPRLCVPETILRFRPPDFPPPGNRTQSVVPLQVASSRSAWPNLFFSGSRKTAEAQLIPQKKTYDMSRVKIFSGRAHPRLAEEVAAYLGTTLGQAELKNFSNGESYVKIKENVRGKETFVIQPTSFPANDNMMELLLMIDALKRAKAKSITAVIPHYGYSRQDRRAELHEPISAKLMANLLTAAGATHVMTVDLHANQVEGFFDIPVDALSATPLTAGYIALKKLEDPVIVSPDEGGVKRASKFAKKLGIPYAIVEKRRSGHNQVESLNVIGDVKGKIAIIVDDMIDTAGTICEAAKRLLENGAKKVIALATHPVFSGPALKRLEQSVIDEVVVTNTIPLTSEAERVDKISQITIAPIIAEAIGRMVVDEPVNEITG